MARRFAWAGTPLLAALAIAAAVAVPGSAVTDRAAAAGACSTHGLRFALHGHPATHYAVTSIRARALTCSRARSVAERIADELLHGQSVSAPGAIDFGMTQESCTGCGGMTTSVSIAYQRGSLTIALRGSRAASSGGAGEIPEPTFPTGPVQGGGTVV